MPLQRARLCIRLTSVLTLVNAYVEVLPDMHDDLRALCVVKPQLSTWQQYAPFELFASRAVRKWNETAGRVRKPP